MISGLGISSGMIVNKSYGMGQANTQNSTQPSEETNGVGQAQRPHGPPPPPRGESMVSAYDSNRDGALGRGELSEENMTIKLLEQFEEIDGDSNGLLTADELDSYGQSKGSQGAGGPHGQRPPPPPQGADQFGGATAESVINALQAAFENQQQETTYNQSILNTLYSDTQSLFLI